MAGNKYMQWVTASQMLVHTAAAQAGGGGSANQIVALDAGGLLDITMMPAGVGSAALTMVATEGLTASNFVNVYDDGGTAKCRKADANNARRAHGYVIANVATAATATIYFSGVNNQATGLTKGAMYYLSTTAGGYTSTPTSTAGNYVQELGVAGSGTEIPFNPGHWIKL